MNRYKLHEPKKSFDWDTLRSGLLLRCKTDGNLPDIRLKHIKLVEDEFRGIPPVNGWRVKIGRMRRLVWLSNQDILLNYEVVRE